MQTTPGTSLSDHPAPEQDTRSHRSRLAVWTAVASVIYALDQGSKWWAERSLGDGSARDVVGELVQFRLTHNAGAAFSVGTGYTIALTVIALVVIAVCLSLASRLGSTWWAVALGLILGGALGNVTDRILRAPAPFRGHVVDFIELPNWPVFNVADSAICVAAAIFVMLSIRGVHLDGTRDGRRTTGGSSAHPTTPDAAGADDNEARS